MSYYSTAAMENTKVRAYLLKLILSLTGANRKKAKNKVMIPKFTIPEGGSGMI